jgi:excinuclease ABC subunit A
VEYVSQSPIGKSSRSNPISYVKGYDAIRNLLADQKLSQLRGYKPGHFSFNVEGGRCETCQGEGEVTISMQFLADIRLTCEDCKGQRFKTEVLEVQYNGKNIYEILDLSIEEALEFFKQNNEILAKIKPLFDVGLGYVKLGQSSSSLSGGEAQRVKLASYLGSKSNQKILFIFDEPTTGLHFHDVQRLLSAFDQLIQIGHSVLIVEHNLDVIRNADWVIDLGPDAGINGGQLVYAGVPSGLKTAENSQTGRFLE